MNDSSLSIESIESIKQDINKYINLFCDEQNINDLREVNQSIWNGCLIYISNNYIIPSNITRIDKDKYNLDVLNTLCDYYIYLCRIYDKECSLWGYSYLTNISEGVIFDLYSNYGGYSNTEKGTSKAKYIYKRLSSEREKSLSDRLLTGKNPVGVLGILNHFYGWAGTGNMTEDRQKQALTLTDLQGKLSDNSSEKGNLLTDRIDTQ